ncbi:MGMT family protein [Brachybacterium nesterenkovii]|uniref:MGMT family protein n=1 Tax=Brachybacterium nesterenkovii TaxID=47847 RepID=UPI002E114FE0
MTPPETAEDRAAGPHPGDRPRVRMDDLTVERVLRTVEAIPPGRVAGYGQIGAIAGAGPRLVGRIMREWGSSVPWWRVTSHVGTVAPPLRARAFERWADEEITVRPDGGGCRMREAGADLDALREAANAAWADLPAPAADA